MKTNSLNNWSIKIATANGSGSQSANSILVKSLFRMGIPVGGKNLFPSNIQGLPTWFTIRVHPEGYVGREDKNHIVIAMNPQTVEQDINDVTSSGYFIFNEDLAGKVKPTTDKTCVGVPFKDLVKDASPSIKMKKLLMNMAYVGFVAALLGIDKKTLEGALRDQFSDKESSIEPNLIALTNAWNYATEKFSPYDFPFKCQTVPNGNTGKILIDGNSASALGLAFGGCGFLSWYPITPSSSLAESFESFSESYRVDSDGRKNFAVIQAEDELGAISMVLGAGWAGARAATTTSGPGLSLMAEAAGLSYFAEIPAVIWDVQRAGPSTGLPTRTMQGDILSAQKLSHGDTQHILLFPSNPEECFKFGKTALDLSEQLQTLVIVLSDLDLGMNFWVSEEFKHDPSALVRGKVLSADDLNQVEDFARYRDVDGDGIPYRTLPGTHHVKAGYFTRGTGHNEKAGYTESSVEFEKLLIRLKHKYETARDVVPQPVLDENAKAKTLVVAFGSTDFVIPEVRAELKNQGFETSYLRLRAWPLPKATQDIFDRYDSVVVVEQNRDGQMRKLLVSDFDFKKGQLKSVLSFDGLPISPRRTIQDIKNAGVPNV